MKPRMQLPPPTKAPKLLKPIKKRAKHSSKSSPKKEVFQPSFRRLPMVVLDDIGSDIQTLIQGLPSKFMAMNDHCILEIMERQSLKDLCAMAETSHRLKELAQYLFRLKYKNLNLNRMVNNDDRIEMKQARSLFANFGHLIESLQISRKLFAFDLPKANTFAGQRKLLILIKKYCLPALHTLTLGHFYMNPELITESIPLFQRLQAINYYRLSCMCSEKKFCHFDHVLRQVFNGLADIPNTYQVV